MSEKYLLLISDIEGCWPIGPNGKEQSRVLCSKEFFERLDEFLNNGNTVAFLGDYFDKGDLAEFTIKEIIRLYKKYNFNKNEQGKVHIILGNRDINKIRIPYELNSDIILSEDFKKNIFTIEHYRTIEKRIEKNEKNFKENEKKLKENLENLEKSKKNIEKSKKNLDEKKEYLSIFKPYIEKINLWKIWYDYYIKLFKDLNTSNTPKISNSNIIKTITEMSMGTLLPRKDIKVNNKVMSASNYSYSCIKNLLELKNESNKNSISFETNMKELLSYGKIAIYDEDFKVLLSHAGGIDTYFFHSTLSEYYDEIIKKLVQKIEDDEKSKNFNYFEYIELCRNMLMDSPPPPLSGNKNLYITKKNNNHRNVKSLIDIVNNVLTKVIKATKDFTVFTKKTLIPEYFLLQALGLKPDNGSHFVSFIESCDHSGCGGPISHIDNKDTYEIYLKSLENLDIKFVACGHKPHCAPVPLVYKRPDYNPNIVFIMNDTSNGYRPASINSIDKIPLSFIKKSTTKNKNEYTVGVSLFNNKKKLSTEINSKNIAENLKNFDFMLGCWDPSKEDFPYFEESNKNNNLNEYVKYPKGKLQFKTKTKDGKFNPFAPALGIPNTK